MLTNRESPRLTATHRTFLKCAAMLFWVCLAVPPARAVDMHPSGPPTQPVLHLLNGGFVTGSLCDSEAKAVLRWKSPAFASPFEFSLAALNAVHFPHPARPAPPVGDYCFELARGDLLFGSLLGLSDSELELNVAKIGRVHVKRSSVHRFLRWRDSADVVYLGPHGLSGWKAAPADAWREEFGHLATSQEGSIRADFGLPAQALIEFELSWKKKPDFVLALGVGDDDATAQRAFRFEVWGSDIVVLRDLEGVSDLASVQSGLPAQVTAATSSAGRLHVQVFLDQKLGRCLVFSTSGNPLADITLAPEKPQVLGGICLENKRGDVRLERLRIARWTGELPREVQADQPRVHLTDGSINYGRVTGYDAAARQFTVTDKSAKSRAVAADLLDSAFLPFPAETDPAAVRKSFQANAKAAPTRIHDETESASARVLLHDGTQASGDIVKVADGALWINCPAVREQLRLPIEGLRSLTSLHHDAAPSDKEQDAGPDADGRAGRLELEGVRLRGRLVDGQEERLASCLIWHPVGSNLASAIRPGVSGRIVYREIPPPPKQAQQTPAAMGGLVRARVAVAARPRATGAASTLRVGQRGAGQPSLYLRTGDTIPCEVTGIDENGVSFKTSLSDSMFVAHDKIKAVELVREAANAPGLTKAKRERLLTLPRMQKDSPPTHLIRSRSGDYLRGRLIGMNDHRLQIEVRLEMKEIPRERVARIIWLHSEDLEKTASAESSEQKLPEGFAKVDSSSRQEKIKRCLDKSISVDFLDLELIDCVNYLGERHGISISVVLKENDDGVTLKKPITLKIDNAKLDDVLNKIFEPLHLTYAIDNEELSVTASAKGNREFSNAIDPVHAPPTNDKRHTRVQVLRNDGSRLTFLAEKFGEGTLSGTSDVLGACRVNLAQIDQLLIGSAIEQAAAQLAYQKWILQNAVEPKFVHAGDGAEDADAGTESPLVGKPAPAFELDLLEGGKFKLADHKGHVLVLDFWATWCGPCLAAMPQVDRATREFRDHGVQLVAVNLEEAPKPIKSMLERHKLDLTVVLDRDGVVAGKYQATAIPQTVIIDRDGIVARVFIGGGAHLEDQLRDALKSQFPENPPPQSSR